MGAPRDEETIELALTTLALAGDSPTRAVAMLADAGVRVSRHALSKWRETYADRYAVIRDVRAREIERSVVHRSRALAERYCELEDKLIDDIQAQREADARLQREHTTLSALLAVAADDDREKIQQALDALPPRAIKDPSTTLRNIAVSKGIAVDKMLIVDGRPNHITEQRSADDVLRELDHMGIGSWGSVDGEASEAVEVAGLPPAA
jgi:hypothetical protein